MGVRLKHLTEDKDRHGNIRVYYRMLGKPKVRLKEPPGTAAFMDEYRCAEAGIPYVKDGKKPAVKKAKAAEGTLAYLCQEYYKRGASLVSADTMYRRRRILEKICVD